VPSSGVRSRWARGGEIPSFFREETLETLKNIKFHGAAATGLGTTNRLNVGGRASAEFLSLGDVFGIGKKIVKGVKKVFGGKPKTGIGCIPPTRLDPRTGKCRVFLGEQTGFDDQDVGEATMGRYGAALVPGRRVVDRSVCLRGMQLGDDGLCYNKGNISNKQRMWPAGRKPLLTGGDMRAIATASRAAGRLERTTKRLQKIGLMKKASRPRRASREVVRDHHHDHH